MTRAGDIPHAIQWHDGMLLSPHHFQESSRRSERLLGYHLGLAAPYHYGVAHLEIDHGLLVSGTLRVLEVEAVMPDNELVHHVSRDAELEIDLKPHAAHMRDRELPVFLVVPRAHLGATGDGELARHISREGHPVVDANTGDSELSIPRIVPNLRLLVAAEPPARFCCLPIARIRLDGEAFIQAEYVPPCLSIPMASPIGRISSLIIAKLREKALRLADKASALSLTTDRELIAEIKRQIHCLVAALPPFEAMLRTDRSHPYPLYLALTALVGQVSALARSPIPPILPAYRHDDLFNTFQVARDHLFRILDEGILESFTAYPLDLEQGRFHVGFQRTWTGKPLVIALKGRRGISEGDVLKWVNGALIGAASKAREMRESRVLGVSRRRIDRLGDLVATAGTFLYELDPQSPYIDAGEPLSIFNPSDPAAAIGPTEIVLYVKSST